SNRALKIACRHQSDGYCRTGPVGVSVTGITDVCDEKSKGRSEKPPSELEMGSCRHARGLIETYGSAASLRSPSRRWASSSEGTPLICALTYSIARTTCMPLLRKSL